MIYLTSWFIVCVRRSIHRHVHRSSWPPTCVYIVLLLRPLQQQHISYPANAIANTNSTTLSSMSRLNYWVILYNYFNLPVEPLHTVITHYMKRLERALPTRHPWLLLMTGTWKYDVWTRCFFKQARMMKKLHNTKKYLHFKVKIYTLLLLLIHWEMIVWSGEPREENSSLILLTWTQHVNLSFGSLEYVWLQG